MKKAIAILAVLSIVAFAGQVAVDLDPVNSDGDWLQYDDGSPQWLTWGGTYRGTWFNVQDFIPGATGGTLEQSRLWFYHHASYPWDTSDVYIEIWNGDATGPIQQQDQNLITALHYTPVFVDYSPEVEVEQNFWCLINTELSAGGWPAALGDGTNPDPSGIDHSFFSDDFIVWEPWNINGACFYFIAVNWNEGALDNATWGSLKATF